MIIMGIDQGLANLGYCFLEVEFKNKCTRKDFIKFKDGIFIKILETNYLSSNPSHEFPKRIFKFITKLENKILEFEPEIICCEKLFFSPPAKGSRNKSSSIMNTNMITGLIAYLCGKYKIDFFTFPPTTVKKQLCDNGKAEKEDIKNKINSIFASKTENINIDHIYDSIAIALTYLSQLNAN